MRFSSAWLLCAAASTTTSLVAAHGAHGAHLKHKHHERAVDARIPWTTADGPLPTKLVVYKQMIEVYNGAPHSDKPATFFYETLLEPQGKGSGTLQSASNPTSTTTATSSTTTQSQVNNPPPPPPPGSSSTSSSSSSSNTGGLSTGSQHGGGSPPSSSSSTSSSSSVTTTTASTNNANPYSGVGQSTSSSTTAASQPSSPANNGPGQSVCWDKGTADAIQSGPGVMGVVGHNHNWDCWSTSDYQSSVGPSKIGGTYVPMLKHWTAIGDTFKFSSWKANVDGWGSQIDMILTFNEPDTYDNAWADAAEGFVSMAQPYVGKMSVVAPSPTSATGPWSGHIAAKDWMVNFFQSCNGRCTPTHLATNFYQTECAADATQAAAQYKGMIDYLTSYRSAVAAVWPGAANLPFVLPEVGCRGSSEAGTVAFLQQLKSNLGSSGLVVRWFWFGMVTNTGDYEVSGGLVGSGGSAVMGAFTG